MTATHASHEHDDALFENLDELARSSSAPLGAHAGIPYDDEPLECVVTTGSLDEGFDLDVDMADGRLA